ncbi:MAG: alpha/beta hydrolase [Verrucomicrobia bacterium]|nr:alpha/beta hydrolase [Verrucomicrobiota bacterium]
MAKQCFRNPAGRLLASVAALLVLVPTLSRARAESASPASSFERTRPETPTCKTWPVIEPTIKDLAYAGKSPAEKLDLYLPAKRSGPAPVVIWIHGGGFTAGDKHSIPRRDFGPPPTPRGPYRISQIQVPNVAALVAKGYAVASLNYRLGTSFMDGVRPGTQDGKAAVRFLRANAINYALDPNRFAVWGNSAGGYIAAILGVTGDQPTLFDDPTLGNAGVSSAVQACVVWYGAENRLPAQLKIATYLNSAKLLPVFRIVNGDRDTLIRVAQAQQLQDALLKAGAKSTLTILPRAGHEDPAFMETQMAPTFHFLDSALRRSQQGSRVRISPS